MIAQNLICSNCGSIYELSKHSIPFRDKDSIDCEVCGKEKLFSWNEAKIYYAKLIKRGEKKS